MKEQLAGLEPISIDAQARNLGLERLPRDAKHGRRTGWARDPPDAGGKSSFNQFLFPIPVHASEAFTVPALAGRSRRERSFQPRLVDGERVAVAENDGPLDD